MAFAKGKASVDAPEFKKYIGIATCCVAAFNPTEEELSKIYGRDVNKGMEYTGTIKDNDGNDVKVAYPTFILKSDPDKCNGIEEFFTARFMITDKVMTNRDNTKCKIIDKYGRTAWATKDDVANKKIPTYVDKNGNTVPFNIDSDYRPCYRGEEELTLFMKNLINIEDCQKYVNNTWVYIDHPSDAECRFDSIKNFINGDFKEIKNAIEFWPNNKVKVAIGVRTNNEGREFSTVYTNITMKNSSTSTKKLEEDINSRKNVGALQNTEFDFNVLHEYTIKETSFEKNNVDDLPFSAPTETPWG